MQGKDKYRLLVKLGMRNRLRELLYGTRFCMNMQKTVFMAPAETVFPDQQNDFAPHSF